jgi:hypothetical protein
MYLSIHRIDIEFPSVLAFVKVGHVPNPRVISRAIEAISNFVIGLLQEFCVGVLVAFGHVDQRLGAGSMLKVRFKYFPTAPPSKTG